MQLCGVKHQEVWHVRLVDQQENLGASKNEAFGQIFSTHPLRDFDVSGLALVGFRGGEMGPGSAGGAPLVQ